MPTYHLSPLHTANLENEIETARQDHPTRSDSEIKDSIARKYNFYSWKQLDNFVSLDASAKEDFLQLAVLQYHPVDSPDRRLKAKEMLAAQPDLSSQSIYHAATCGDVKHVQRFLDADSELVNQPGGQLDWSPLLYACYSRLEMKNESFTGVVKLLLDRGADPNVYFMWGGQYRFTALTGVFGEGERGPTNQPRHPAEQSIARMLLEAGASPNDSQGIYNRMFTGDTSHLKLMLCYGLNREHRPTWLDVNKSGVYYSSRVRVLTYLFNHALERSHADVLKLLLDANVVLTRKQKTRAHRIAMLNGNQEIADMLLGAGCKRSRLNANEKFVYSVLNDCLDELGLTRSALLKLCTRSQTSQPDALIKAINQKNMRAIDLLLGLQWDLNDDRLGVSALHEAAYAGPLEIVERLVNAGADLNKIDSRFNTTPEHWARVGNQTEIAEYLQALT